MRTLRPFRLSALFTTTALIFAACGSEEPEAKPGTEVGAKCTASASPACADGLECTAREGGGTFCTYPAGAECKPDDKELRNGGCSDQAECAEAGDATEATCLIVEGEVCDLEDDLCTNGMSCAEVDGGEPHCFGEVMLSGQVTDTSDDSPVADAHVIALNDEGVAVTDVAITDEDGNYDLEVPAVRNEDGSPVSATFTLHAAAQDYQPFPSGVRVALPIDVGDAVEASGNGAGGSGAGGASASEVGGGWVVDNALTQIGLIPLPNGDRVSISGNVVALEGDAAGEVGGVLVVATGDDGSFSGISDKEGAFTVFNVSDGDYVVKGYAADIQIDSEDVAVSGEDVEGVELMQLDSETTTVGGNVQIVNAPGGSQTSVILVVADTFNPLAARGEVPRGLRAPRTGAPDVDGDFTIEGVPEGSYYVLAAYENDDLVRDPDTNISGTDFVTIDVVAGDGDVSLSDSFKVTEALATIEPGADGPEAVDGKPTLVWADDSSEDWYDVRVFDAFGNEVWTSLELPGVSGGDDVSVDYDGPLEPGMYYQFRVSSWRQPGNGDAAPISTTEDLRGVFFLPAE